MNNENYNILLSISEDHLYKVSKREEPTLHQTIAVYQIHAGLEQILKEWGGPYLNYSKLSGSFAKGTANKSSSDIDVFISLSKKVYDDHTLKEIYENLYGFMRKRNYAMRRQGVSINATIDNYSVDLVPAVQQHENSTYHSLYLRRSSSWIQTNIETHIKYIIYLNRTLETRLLKLWRDQQRLEFPSFYLEMSVIEALVGTSTNLSHRMWKVFNYLKDDFVNKRIVDLANTNNIISNDLTLVQKANIASAAKESLKKLYWPEIIK